MVAYSSHDDGANFGVVMTTRLFFELLIMKLVVEVNSVAMCKCYLKVYT